MNETEPVPIPARVELFCPGCGQMFLAPTGWRLLVDDEGRHLLEADDGAVQFGVCGETA